MQADDNGHAAVTAPVILGPDAQPARLPKTARCPQCGAGAESRLVSGLGAVQEVTCEACAYEFPKERAS